MELTRVELDRIKLTGDNILIHLPAETDDKNQTLKSGLVASFLYSDKEKYAPVQGIVVKRSGKNDIVQDGDTAFFHYLNWGNAQQSFESFNNGHYDGTKLAITCGADKYLIMRESELFFAKRGDRYIGLNDIVILRAIPKELKQELIKDMAGNEVGKVFIEENGGLVSAICGTENYRLDLAEVVCCPEGLGIKVGDIIFPDKNWDVPLEYEILETIGETLYYVKADVILDQQN